MSLREAIEVAEQYVVAVMDRRRHGRADVCVRAGLFMLSRLYRNLVQLRFTLYRERILRQRVLGCLVVSVGNLTCGGTGKTPVVEVFARTLAAKGRRVAILSRGYRSKAKPFRQWLRDLFIRPHKPPPPRVVSDGSQLLLDSAMAGDEPYMLAKNLPNVRVLVDKDRVKSGRYAIRELGADTLVLDDGFQYLRLKPRLNILLVDATNPFHNHQPLPRGLLREPIKNLRRADYVFLTKVPDNSRTWHLRRFIRRHNPRAEIIECTHRSRHLEHVFNGSRLELDTLRGKRVAALSGIAVPESFESVLTDLGADLVYRERYMDHHRYRRREVLEFLDTSRRHGAELVVTTEKDAVRLPVLDAVDAELFFLRVQIEIVSGAESFNECITRICFL